MVSWLRDNRDWIIPLTAILGTATAILFRLWLVLRRRREDASDSREQRKRIARICKLTYEIAGCVLAFASIGFLFLLFMVLPTVEQAGMVRGTGILLAGVFGIGLLAVVAWLIGKYGETWFKD